MDLLTNTSVYHGIIGQVLHSAKDILEEAGIDEGVLVDLKSRWTEKYAKRHPVDYAPVPNPNANTNMHQHHQQKQAPQQKQQHGAPAHSYVNTIIPQRPYIQTRSEAASVPRMSQSSQQMPNDLKRGISFDDGQTNAPKSKRMNFPGQYDGSVDTTEFIDASDEDYEELEKKLQEDIIAPTPQPADQNGSPEVKVTESAVVKQNAGSIEVSAADNKDDDADAVEEDSDCLLDSQDDLDDSDETDMYNNNDYFIVCQWDKVTRSKTKWTVQLRHGIIHNKGREYAFLKACGTLKW